jgi:replication factor A1
VLWGESATSFPAEEVHKDGQSSLQIVIFIGTLVKCYGGVSLSGGTSCKWYINPQVPEAEVLMNRYGISCSYLIIFVALVDWLGFYDTII